jgi:enamine deaminase RidA (YjgF/YER057c/UK114 family)
MYEFNGEHQSLELESDDLKEVIEQACEHFAALCPELASGPDLPAKLIYVLGDAYAQDRSEAYLQL